MLGEEQQTRGGNEKGLVCQDHWEEGVRKDDPFEYFLPTGFWSTFWVSEAVMAVETSQNKESFEEGKNGRREGVGLAIHQRRANRESITIEKRERERVI